MNVPGDDFMVKKNNVKRLKIELVAVSLERLLEKRKEKMRTHI
jgi:putative sigma-54 modulation protein